MNVAVGKDLRQRKRYTAQMNIGADDDHVARRLPFEKPSQCQGLTVGARTGYADLLYPIVGGILHDHEEMPIVWRCLIPQSQQFFETVQGKVPHLAHFET